MQTLLRALPLLLVLPLAACGETVSGPAMTSQPVVTAPMAPMMSTVAPEVVQAPAVATTTGVANTDIASYVDAAALPLMSAKERSDASSAQFFALQFGRPGAPRTWSGSGSKGSVVVGPYVKVNNIDCRDFTHTVTVGGQDYVHKGTACREGNGKWSVAAGGAA